MPIMRPTSRAHRPPALTMCSAWISPCVGDDIPRPVGALAEVGHPRVPVDLGAGVAGADGVGVGDAGRVDVALDRVEQRADEVLLLQQREDGLGLGRRDDLQVHAQVPAAGLGHAQPVQALAGVGQHQAARQVDGAALAGGGLDLLVELDGVLLQLGDVGVAVERVHAAGGVPGRAGGQLLALDEDDVGPSRLGQVVEHRGADDSATDHDDLCGRLHRASPRGADDLAAGAEMGWGVPKGEGIPSPLLVKNRLPRRPRPYGGRRSPRAPRGPRPPSGAARRRRGTPWRWRWPGRRPRGCRLRSSSRSCASR